MYASRIRNNADRFCRNPYFLHSVCTANAGLVADTQSLGGYRHGTSSKASFLLGDNVTISEYGKRRKSRKQVSEGGFDYGQPVAGAPKIRKKVRPFSAPRH